MKFRSSQIYACRSSLKLLESHDLRTMQSCNSHKKITHRTPRLLLRAWPSAVDSTAEPHHLEGLAYAQVGHGLNVDGFPSPLLAVMVVTKESP
jgi:hypothetical protein